MANAPQVISPLQEVQGTLSKMGDQFKMSLPVHIKPERFIRAAQTAIQNNPDLLQVSRPSLYNACMKCAQDGLLPDGREAAIVKFGADAGYIPMIAGILKLIRNSGELATIDAEVVHEKDEYDSWTDERGQHFKFKKNRGERGAPMLTFAYALTKDGHLYFEEVTEAEMASIQKMARSQNVWTGGFRDEMKKKSALHRLAKRMPKSTDIEQVLKADEELYDLEKTEEVKPEATTSTRLNDAITGGDKQKATDAEVTPTPAPTVQASTPDGTKTSVGILFEKLSQKNSPEGAPKKWTKFGGLSDGKWYGTFDTKIADLIQYSIQNRALMNMVYTEKDDKGKTYYNIVSLEQTSTDDNVQQPPQADDDIPI